jgi:predicted amino acid racemase
MRILDMIPHDPKIEIMEASSDHLLVDITQSDTDYKVGDIYDVQYAVHIMPQSVYNPYIDKEYIL